MEHKIGFDLVPNREFARLASDTQIEAVVNALETRNIHAVVANSGEEAKKLVLDLVPQGAEVYANVSKTLEDIGVTAEIDKSGRYD
ncbi:MAG: LUD domain-containing protein, partial [Syntrophothermus sp.]